MGKYTQIQFRPGVESDLSCALSKRAEQTTDIALSQVARRDLERYYATLTHSLPDFSESEVIILLNVLNGVRVSNPQRLYVEVQENYPEHKEFVERLRNFSYAQCLATIDAVERYWCGEYHKSPEEMRVRLREVGLIR